MWDVAYVLITLLFFAAMLWYVQGCKPWATRVARTRRTTSAGHPAVAATAEEVGMSAESVLAILLAVALIAYLMYSLLRPERF